MKYLDIRETDILLRKMFRGRIDIDIFSLMCSQINGTLDKKTFSITFCKEEYLLVSTSENTKEVLEELLPVLKTAMAGKEPICKYDMVSKDKKILPTIEWDVKDPDARLKEIVNGRAFSDDSTIENLELFDEKKVEDFLESEEEKQEMLKNVRVFGIDKGSIQDVEKINNLSEVDLFLAIEGLGGHIWRCMHDMSHGRIEEIDLTEEQYALEYMVYQTTKFGVELPEPQPYKHIEKTPSYNAWYNFYRTHFKETLSQEEWDAFAIAKKSGMDVSQFMPTGDWRDLLKKESEKQLKKQNN